MHLNSTNLNDAEVAKKSNFSGIKLSILACAILVGGANAYTETGVIGNTSSWESAEYKKDWGLVSMKASIAYALGATGEGVKLGVMDSGVLLSHPELNDGRVSVVKYSGTYGKDGMRYPDAQYGNGPIDKKQPVKNGARNYDLTDKGEFKKGQAFEIDGGYIKYVNDAHGTHVGGTMAGTRDGKEMHGVAFKSLLYSANTGGNDNMTYGPTQDYIFFLKGYTALADAGAKFINNSWGSNRKVASAFPGATGYKSSGGVISETNNPGDHMNLKNLEAAKKAYFQFILTGEKSFTDAAYEVAVNRGVVQVFTAGNRTTMQYPFTRAMLPYFRPDAEQYWVNVTGQDGEQDFPNGTKGYNDNPRFNESRGAKWWTVAAPASSIYSAYIELMNDATYGAPIYRSAGGTSMAAPHVTAAMGVIQSRYRYLTPSQVRDVMLTNARQTKFVGGTTLNSWTAPAGVPDDVWGWGILDLGTAMFGPGQFLGTFDVNMPTDDIWSNNISDVALKYRKTEDNADAATWAARKAVLDAKASLSAEEKAEYDVEVAREKARAARSAQGYEGALIKRGEGTLTLAGSNTFTGETTINGGKISALNQSIGNSKHIAVNKGGELEILRSVDVKTPSSTGFQTTTRYSDATAVKATIKSGGAFVVNDETANLNVKFEEGSLLKAGEASVAQLDSLLRNPASTLTYSATGNFVDPNKASLVNDYAFFTLTKEIANQSNLKLALKKSADMKDVAQSDGAKSVASAIQAAPSSALYQSLLGASRTQAQDVYSSLANDYGFAAQNNALVNSLMIKNSVLNQSNAIRANVDTGVELWTSTNLNRITTDKNLLSKFSTNSFTQLLGIDFLIGDSSKVGTFIGLGKTKSKINGIKESKDKDRHLGVYGEIGLENVSIDLGVMHTKTDRERKQLHLTNTGLADEYKSTGQSITSVFAQAAYTGFNSENFSIEPYAGFGYIHTKTDGYNNKLIGVSDETRNVSIATAGIRPSVPFTLGATEFKAKADLAYNQFFGDKAPEANINIFGVGQSRIKGAELKNLTTLDIGIDAMITKSAKFGISYIGAYSSDIKSNGVSAKFSLSF